MSTSWPTGLLGIGFPTQYATLSITIKVEDVNEFAPQFNAARYQATVPENSPINSLVAQVSATDGDGDGRVDYFINSTSDFSINSRGIVVTAAILDADVVTHRNVTISACDAYGLCSSVQLHIYLTDVNDNFPEFLMIPRELNVTEDTPYGTILLNATAVDIDRDDTLSYWVTGAADLLSIDQSSGVLRITGSPRALEVPVYYVTVHVSDGPHQVQAFITIFIQEANLYAPEFSKFAYHEIICETDELGQVLMEFSVTDEDDGVDGIVDVRITNGDWNNSFQIRPHDEYPNTFELINVKPLVFAERPYFELELEASDAARYPRYDYSRATIRLLSGSSSPPLIQPVVAEEITVSDKARAGDVVYTFVALVKGTDEKRSLRFSVVPLNDEYQIDNVTGHLTLTSDTPSDAFLNVSACSTTSSECFGGLETKLCSHIEVILKVKNEPRLPQFFPTSYFNGEVMENVASSPIVKIFANQTTERPVNLTMISNELYDDLFVLIDNTIWHTTPLDREKQDAYNLFIVAYGDAGIATANVHIKVLDSNDEPPVFVFSEFRVETVESATSAGHVITVVSVTDDDSSSENIQVDYRILPSADSYLFELLPRGQQCDVILTDQLDADIVSNETVASVIYSITLEAYDPTRPSALSNATVQVLVRDDNDNSPIFIQSLYWFDTEEETEPTATASLGTIRATDKDKVDIGKLRYRLLEESDVIVMDAVYGVVQLNRTIDKETTSHLSFTVQALDSAGHIGEAQLEIEVIDRNDNKPEFLNDTLDFDVFEGPDSLILVELLVRDADFEQNSALMFYKTGLACDYFNIRWQRTDEHLHSLIVESIVEMDRENTSTPHLQDGTAVFSCLITATDNGLVPLSSSKMVRLRVLDTNDSPPRFTTASFEWAITEVSPVNFTVGYVTATDSDYETENKQMIFQLQKDLSSLFSLDPLSGELYLTRQVASSANDIRLHILQIVVFDPSNPNELKDDAEVKVHILDSNNHAPVFSQLRYTFPLSTNFDSNTVGQVFARDNDTEPWNAEIFYSLQFFTEELPFSIDNATGVISTTLRELTISNTFLFGVVAHDKGIPRKMNRAIVEVVVIAFSSSSYTGTIEERSVFNHTVKIQPPIYAADSNALPSLLYTLEPQDGFGIFAIQESSAAVYVKTDNDLELDYEKTHVYYLQVVAGDLLGWGVKASLTIHVTDVNDNPPVFSQTSYNFTVSEGSRNMVFGRVTSSDVDTDAQTLYRLIGDSGPFLMDADTGVLRVTGGLDVETYPVHHLDVEARDRDNPDFYDTASITIIVEDINDNSPAFSQENYFWTVPEDAPVNSVIGIVSVGDLDNDTVVFSVANVSQDLPFTVHRLTGEITLGQLLDRERISHYRFMIKAEDSTLSNHTQVLVIVTDVNDNPPSFTEKRYLASVMERSPISAIVMAVFATDMDEPDTNNSRVAYSLNGTGNELFNITDEGLVKVAEEFTIFRLIQLGMMTAENATLSLYAVAKDFGQPALSSTALIQIKIHSSDADLLVFEQPLYQIEVKEHEPIGTKVATVSASGSDSDRAVGVVILYKLIGSNPSFSIADSQTGDIYIEAVLDRELEAFFLYTVEAMDNASPPKTAYVTVMISLLDINDHSPEFDNNRLELFRAEGTYNSTMLTQVQAQDADIGVNAEITYSIIGGSREGMFNIDPVSGVIYMHGDFDYESERQMHLTIEAIDNGSVRRTDTLNLFLYLTDENDNFPVFESARYGPYKIKENVHEVQVTQISAIDDDSGNNGEVHYALLEGDLFGDFLLVEDNSTGV
ncbi:protocadherin Fat 4-like [Watersipora subatra]|uniref:protocadherin Fat 4-like n=1 Tax=Watersipora subatra TaxID=2589382 RepID=UPI00355B468D